MKKRAAHHCRAAWSNWVQLWKVGQTKWLCSVAARVCCSAGLMCNADFAVLAVINWAAHIACITDCIGSVGRPHVGLCWVQQHAAARVRSQPVLSSIRSLHDKNGCNKPLTCKTVEENMKTRKTKKLVLPWPCLASALPFPFSFLSFLFVFVYG